ncbi:DMT family transporter [Noviherbaspirillum autotrophicum]|uniref:Multidrug DMT transporter permease n=1 Tax=Noviherbaspirillum autotrophicum TaxID=709839 RepID=A0A0C1YRC9_9BURK|nr:DMT family transporter [Noviherbaspirillum autotrophicum]KIF83207.1 multidrug DMT transporter permease [Noviherbaspirillum autotrophicum]
MSNSNLARLFLLGAIWGTSFLLMRIAAPALGPLLTTFVRALLGGAALFAVACMRGVDFAWRRNAKAYLVIGLFNTAIPFSLFAWSALYIPSAYMATMNSLAPVFTALFGFLLLGERLTFMRLAAFVLGLAGVGVLVGVGPTAVTLHVALGVLAAIGAAVCYGYAATYTRMKAGGIPSLAAAAGSQLAASVALLPFALTDVPHAMAAWTPTAAVAVTVLGLVCTGVAYAIFFHLISAEGASKAITVTFLVPATASIWAWLLLDEPITAGTVAGISVVLCATAMALGLVEKWKSLRA